MNQFRLSGSRQWVGASSALELLEPRLVLAVAEFDGGSGGTGTSWHEPANWVGDVLPASGDDVVINTPGVTEVVYSMGQLQLASITSQRPLRINGGEIRLPTSAPANLFAPLTIAGGALQGGRWMLAAGGVVTGQTPVMRAAEVVGDLALNANPSTLTVQQGLNMTGRVLLGTNGTLRYETEQTWDGLDGGTLEVIANGSSNGTAAISSPFVNPAIVLTLGPDVLVRGSRFNMGGGSVINRGAIRLEAGGQASLQRLTNLGSVENLGGNLSLLNVTGDVSNIVFGGTGGTVSISGDFAHVGTTTIPAGAELTLSGNWINRGHIVVAGIWDISGTALASRLGSYAFSGDQGAIELRGSLVNDLPEASIAAGGVLRLRGGKLLFGTWRLLSPLTFSASDSNELVSLRIIGSMSDSGGQNDRVHIDGSLVLDGVITLSSSGSMVRGDGASITTVSGAEIRLNVPTTASAAAVVAGEIGTGVVLRGGHAAVQVAVIRGEIVANRAGTVIGLNDTFVHHGVINASAGSVVVAPTAVMSGPGAVIAVGGEFIVEGQFNNTARTRSFDATTGSWSVRTNARLIGGTWNFNGAGLNYSGTGIRVFDAVWNGAHSLIGTASVHMMGSFTLNANITLSQTFVLYLMDLSSVISAAAGRLIVPTGAEVHLPVVIGSGITIESAGGSLFPRSINTGGTRNDGVIRAASGDVLLSGGVLENRGRVEVDAGALLAIAGSIIGSVPVAEPGSTVNFRSGASLYLEGGSIELHDNVTWQLERLVLSDGSVNVPSGVTFAVSGPNPGVMVLNNIVWTGNLTHASIDMTVAGGTRLNGDFELVGSSRVHFGNISSFAGVMTFAGISIRLDGILRGSGSIRLNHQSAVFTALAASEILSDGWQSQFEIHITESGPLQIGVTSSLRIGAGVTIRGGMVFNSGGGSNLIVNNGAIVSDVPGRTVSFGSQVTLVNNGLIEARDGGGFSMGSATLLNRVNGSLIGGTWRVAAGSTMNLGSLGRWINQASVIIDGLMANFNSLGLMRGNEGRLSISGGAAVEFVGSDGAEWVNRGHFAIGANSRVTVNGVAKFDTGSTVQVVRATGAVQSSFVVNGTLTAGGELTAELASTAGVELGTRYDILQATTLVGSFALLQTPFSTTGLAKQVLLAASSRIELLFTSRADIDNSGVADLQDLFNMLNRWFSNDTTADLDGSGSVALEDLFVFLNVWFTTRT